MANCWTKFVDCAKALFVCCKPAIKVAIEVAAEELNKILSDKLKGYTGLDPRIKKALEESIKTGVDSIKVVTENTADKLLSSSNKKIVDKILGQHVKNCMEIVKTQEKNAALKEFTELLVKNNYLDQFIANDNNHINQDTSNQNIKLGGDVVTRQFI